MLTTTCITSDSTLPSISVPTRSISLSSGEPAAGLATALDRLGPLARPAPPAPPTTVGPVGPVDPVGPVGPVGPVAGPPGMATPRGARNPGKGGADGAEPWWEGPPAGPCPGGLPGKGGAPGKGPRGPIMGGWPGKPGGPMNPGKRGSMPGPIIGGTPRGPGPPAIIAMPGCCWSLVGKEDRERRVCISLGRGGSPAPSCWGRCEGPAVFGSSVGSNVFTRSLFGTSGCAAGAVPSCKDLVRRRPR